MRYYIEEERTVWRAIGDEIILLNLDSGNYYNLNKTGALIWKLIEKGKSVEEIKKSIVYKYDIPLEKASRDVGAIIQDFKSQSLITSKN